MDAITTGRTSTQRAVNAYRGAQIRARIGKIAVYTILLLGCLATLVPFLWMVSTSLKPSTEIIRVPPTLLPENPTFKNYAFIFDDPKVPLERFYLNSFLVSSAVVLMTLFTSSLAGFIFAKYQFSGRNLLFSLLLATMMIPFQVTMIPLYLLLVKLGLTNSLWGLIVPGMTSAFGIFLMRQFIESIPGELIDAARIDGSSEFDIYARIILPQMGPALATLGIFQFMTTWNDYLWPLIVITTTENRTLPIMLTWYTSSRGAARHDLTMAASVLVILPILIVYFAFQRWIVQGITMTGFK